MRTSNFGKGRQIAGFFRLCLGIIVSFTLALGGIALNTGPVQANTIVTPAIPPTLPECVPFTYSFSVTWPPPIPPRCGPGSLTFMAWPNTTGVPGWMHLDGPSGVLTGCPPQGSNGTLVDFWVVGWEWDPSPCGVNWFFPAYNVNFTVGPPPSTTTLFITPTFYPVAWESMPFTMTLAATGCSSAYNWTASGLPAGLSVTDPVLGYIAGVPDPGTCGFYNVTVTCTDTGMCPTMGCCPPVNASFMLIVDCYANYAMGMNGTSTAPATYDFTVEIGPGLTAGQTNVIVDGTQEATLGGTQTKTFTAQEGESHSVTVDQYIQGTDPKTRFAVKGTNEIMVSETNAAAYFDYAQQVLIDTGSDPVGISQPGGTGWYAIGDYFNTTTASPINSVNQQGTKYIFRSWSLPDGGTNPNRDLAFTVNRSGTATALYDTYYLLQVKSDYPSVDESSYELKGSTANYNLALQAAPMLGFWGFLGGVLRPVNSSGTHLMDGPYTQKIMWSDDYTVPVIVIVITLLIIAAVVFFLLRRKRGDAGGTVGKTGALTQPPADAAVTTVKALPDDAAEKSLPKAAPAEPIQVMPPLSAAPPDKKALPEAESAEKPGFCSKCGSPVDKDAEFCKKCGNKV